MAVRPRPGTDKYPLAPNGIFRSYQGEGPLLGEPMAFVRLAGCSVGCPACDTDYRVADKMTAPEIARSARNLAPCVRWAWITGGEPTDHDVTPLVASLRAAGFLVAMVTSGVRPVLVGSFRGGVDYLYVSPHDPARWVQRSGDVLNLVPGLNGFGLDVFGPALAECADRFSYRYVTPCEGDPGSLKTCLDWLASRPRWRLGIQAHKRWDLP
jgi:hypothetical protein